MARAPIDPDRDEAIDRWTKNENNILNNLLQQGRSFSGREKNCCFLNTRGPRFANISACSGLDYFDDSRSLALVDWDHDGDQDLWMANRTGPRLRFLRNDVPHKNHFVSLRLRGSGPTTNRDAIGARVEVVAEGVQGKQIKTLYAGSGYQSQSSKWVTFGLGQAEKIQSVHVRWPGGEAEQFEGADVDGWFQLVEGTGAAEPWTPPQRKLDIQASPTVAADLPPQSRTIAVAPYPMLRLAYKDFNGQQHDAFLRGSGQPVLVNLWASFCLPCRTELKEFTHHAGEIRATGLDIVALNVDNLSDLGDDDEQVANFLKQIDFPFRSGKADVNIRRRIQFVYDSVYDWHQPLPAPLSLLINGDGYVAAIYKGAVDVDQLLVDVQQLTDDPIRRRELAQPFPGRWVAEPGRRELVDIADNFRKLGYLEDAVDLYHDMLAADADDGNAHYFLGRLYLRQKQSIKALEHLRTSQRLMPQPLTQSFMAIALTELGQYDDALLEAEQAAKSAPELEQVQLNYSSILSHQQQVEDAMAVLRTAIRSKPDGAKLYLALGGLLRQADRGDEAIALYQQGLKAIPEQANLTAAIGTEFARQERRLEAIEYFERALQLDPNLAAVRTQLEQIKSATAPDTKQ